MSGYVERDYVLRLVQKAALLLARILRLRGERHDGDALRAAEMAYGELFGIDRRFLQFLTPAMLADRLGHPRVAQAFCELMAEEADLRKLQGDPVTASVLAQQALALLDEAHVPEEGLRLKLRDLRG